MRIASAAWSSLLVSVIGCSSGSTTGKAPSTPPEAAPPPDATAAAEPTPAETPDERQGLVRSEPLPELAAKVMRKQMGRHAQRMEGLQWSALLLNYETTKAISSSIASEPRIARPTGDMDTINQIIPPAFYDLQDELHSAAGELATASEAKDDPGMTKAYARLTKTCISCHSLYLRMPGTKAEAKP